MRAAHGFKGLLLAGSAAAGLGLIMPGLALPAVAQSSAATPDTLDLAQAAPAGQPLAFDIPAGPLPAALTAFAARAGIQLLYPAALARGKITAGVSGRLTPQAALRRLLDGSGLAFRFTDAATATLLEAPRGSDATMLAPVTVEGRRRMAAESALGPVDGYVARRSATGTKTDTPLIETPQSISVVTRDNMETRNAQTVNEALRYTAGVKVDPYGPDTRHDWIFVRGFDAHVQGLYVNGLRWQAGQIAGRIEPYGLERVEVMKGPASVLYGQAQPGGLVNLVTKRPGLGDFGELRLEAGSYDRFQGAFDTNAAVGDEWQLRATGLLRDADTHIDYVEDNRQFIAPALTWRPNDRTSLTVLSTYQHDDASGTQFMPANGSVFATQFGRIPISRFLGDPNWDRFDREQYSLGYHLEHALDETWTLRQNIRYSGIDTKWRQVYTTGLLSDNRTITRFGFEANIRTDVVATDHQAQAKFDTGEMLQHTALFGLDYSMTRLDNFQKGTTVASLDVYNPSYGIAIPDLPVYTNVNQTVHQTGVYLQDQIKIGAHWILTLGGRQDWVYEDGRSGPTATASATTLTEREDAAFSYRAGLGYLFDSGLAPYASYSTSFLPTAGSDIAGRPFDPSESKQYEAGVKYQPPGRDSSVTAAVFHLTRENVLTPNPSNPSFNVQTGEVEVRGLELEGAVDLLPGLNVIGSYSLLDTEITKSNRAGETGKQLDSIPKHAASLWADYSVQDGDLAGFGLGAGLRYNGPSYAGNTNAFEVPSFTLFDAMLRYDYENWRFALNASNLFDKHYVSQCASMTYCYYGSPRTVIASVRYRW